MKKIALLFIATIFMFACQPKKSETTEGTADSTAVVVEETQQDTTTIDVRPEETFYTLRGQIIKIGTTDAEGNAMITVSHEEIPDVMMAMQMDLKTNAAFLSEIKKDDKVSFEMLKTEEGYSMRNIDKLPAETELTLKK